MLDLQCKIYVNHRTGMIKKISIHLVLNMPNNDIKWGIFTSLREKEWYFHTQGEK